MSNEENKNRCPKCDKGRLKILKYRSTEADGRKIHAVNAKLCQLCKTIICDDPEITFYQKGYQ